MALFLALEIGYLAVARARGAWLGGGAGDRRLLRAPPPALARARPSAAMAAIAMRPWRWRRSPRPLDRPRFARRQTVRAGQPRGPRRRRPELAGRAHPSGLWRRTLALYRDAVRWRGSARGTSRCFSRSTPSPTRPRTACCRRRPSRGAPTTICWSGSPRPGRSVSAALLALYARRWALPRSPGREARAAGRPPRRFGDTAAACAGSLAAFVGCGLTGFPFAMPATVFLFGVALGPLAAEAPAEPSARRRRRPSAPGSPSRRRLRSSPWLLGLAAFAAWWSARRLEASYFIARSDAALRAGDAPPSAAARVAVSGARRAAEHRATSGGAARRQRPSSQRRPPAEAAPAARRALAIEPVFRQRLGGAGAGAARRRRPAGRRRGRDARAGDPARLSGALATARAGRRSPRRRRRPPRRPRPADRAGGHRRRRPPSADHARPRGRGNLPPHGAADRHRSRLDRLHAGRRARSRIALPPLPARARVHPALRAARRLRRRSPRATCAPPSPICSPATCRSARPASGCCCRSSHWRSNRCRSTSSISIISSSHAVAKGAIAAAGRAAPLVRPLADAVHLGGGRATTRRRSPAAPSAALAFAALGALPAPVGRRLDGAGARAWRPTASTRRRASAGSTAATPR